MADGEEYSLPITEVEPGGLVDVQPHGVRPAGGVSRPLAP